MKFKRPTSIYPRVKRDERQIKVLAMQLRNQDMLDTLLAGTTQFERDAMMERLRPYLRFELVEATPDCPHCGLRRGSAIAHSCQTP
jgi:hypothetical protein